MKNTYKLLVCLILLSVLALSGCSGLAAPSQSTTGQNIVKGPGTSKSNPAAVGQTVEFTKTFWIDGSSGEYRARLTMLDVKRGDAAVAELRKDYPTWPDVTMRYDIADTEELLVAKFRFELLDLPGDNAYDVSILSFDTVYNNKVDTKRCLYTPEPYFNGKLYKGGTTEGWVTFIVDKDAKDILIVFEQDYNSGVWFKT